MISSELMLHVKYGVAANAMGQQRMLFQQFVLVIQHTPSIGLSCPATGQLHFDTHFTISLQRDQ